MVKVNKIKFDKIKAQYDILKMRAAYIAAEQHIIKNSSSGMADGIAEIRYEHDMFGNVSAHTLSVRDMQIEKLEEQAANLEEAGRDFMKREEYLLYKKTKELWEKTMKQLNNLRSK